MMMDVVINIPVTVLAEVMDEWGDTDCARRQVVFQLFHGEEWRYYWCCGPNRGPGSDNGYGVGHSCSKSCDLRIPLHTLATTARDT